MRALYILTFFLIFSSTVAQDFFTPMNGPFGGQINDVVRHSSGALIAATNNGVWRSTDEGANWTKATTGASTFFNDLDIDATGNIYALVSNIIFKSTDGGVVWTNLNSTGFSGALKIKAASASVIYIAANTIIYKSENSGTSFAQTGSVPSLINDLTVHPANSSIVYVATNSSGVRVSTDGGFVFNAPSSGTISSNDYAMSVVVNGTTGHAFALTSGGVHTSTNNGSIWSSIKGTIADTDFLGLLAKDPSDNLYLINNDSRKIYSGTAGGPPWSAGATLPEYVYPTSFAWMSATSWFVGSQFSGVQKTTNSGTSWTDASNGLRTNALVRDIFVTDQGRIFLAYGNRYYLQSISNGDTWAFVTAANTNRTINGFLKLADNSVIAYGSGIIRSTGVIGTSWAEITTGFFSQIVTDGTNLFSYSGTNLLKSTDGGANWTSTAISGFLSCCINKIQADVNGNVYARISNNTLYKINSGSSTATLITSAQDFSVLNNDGSSSIYALSTTTNLRISTNGGNSWADKTISPAANRIWAFRNKVLVSTSTGNNSFNISYNEGSTWASHSLVDNTARVLDVKLNSTEVAYIAATNSVAHRTTSTIIPPNAPSELEVVGYSSVPSRIKLIWEDNADNETSYTVEYSIGNNTSYQTWTGSYGYLGSSGYAFGGVSVQGRHGILMAGDATGAFLPNTTYYFKIAAVNAAGQSSFSNEVSLTTPDNTCLSEIPDNRSWTATAIAEPGSTASGPGPFQNSAVSITKTSGNTYHTNAQALGVIGVGRPIIEGLNFAENCGQTLVLNTSPDIPNGNGSWNPVTNTLTLKWQSNTNFNFFQGTTTYVLNPTDPVPTTPQMNLYIYSPTEVFVNWSRSPFATQYKIYRSNTSGGTFNLVATINYPGVSYVDKNLNAGSTYYYKISALNAAGESAQSAEGAVSLTNTLFRPVENDISLNFENQQGMSWGDLDGDGDEDIVSPSFTNNLGQPVPPVVYENVGGGQFTRKSITALANETPISRGIGVFDFNNDGKLDLYIARASIYADLLLINNGNWEFTKTVVDGSLHPNFSAFKGLAIGDYDQDGFADIYVGTDNANGGTVPPTNENFLFKNNAGASLIKITEGIQSTEPNNSRTVSFVDYDNDGDLDLFVLNYSDIGTLPNILYRNNDDGTFTKVTGLVFDTDIFAAARTISWGDIDNDGDLDLFIGSLSAGVANRLYQNNGNGTFTQLTSSTVAETGTVTYGSTFGDIDNDGDLDLIVVNSGANSVFLNNGSGTFTKSSSLELFNHPNLFHSGVALADFDKDGYLDVIAGKGQTAAVDIPNLLFKNNRAPEASRNWLQVKLVGKFSNKAALGARVKVITTSPARTQIREVAALTGYGAQNSLIQHFGLGTATVANTLEIRWPSGVVQTLTNVAINQILTVNENDGVIPVATPVTPLHNATNVSTATSISFSFTKSVEPVVSKEIKIFNTADLSTPVYTALVTTATKEGNTFTFTPTSQLETNTTYTVVLDAGSFIDVFDNVSPAIAANAWRFTTKAPPQITFTAIPALEKGFGSHQFKITVTDITTILSTAMWHRKISGTGYASIPGVLNTGSGEWEFAVQESFFDETGLEYYFTAQGTEGRNPAGVATHKTLLSYGGPNTNIPSGALGFGGQRTTWKVLTIPFDLGANNSVAAVLDELAGDPEKVYKVDWRFITLQDDKTWMEYPTVSTFERGKGYFINILNSTPIKIADQLTAPSNNKNNLFEMNLRKGWNMIGNPYLSTIDWSNVVTLNGLSGTVSQLKTYVNGSYTNATTLAAFTGGFVLADNDITGVKIPFQGQTSVGGRMGEIENTELDKPEWIVGFTLNQADVSSTLGGIGMHPTASISRDAFDDFNPPRFIDFLEMNFDHPEHIAKKFSRDVVPTNNEFKWEFTVDSNLGGLAELNWDNSGFGNSAKELYLFDVALQRPVNMRTQNSYIFSPRESSQFYVYFGENLESKIKPSHVTLGKAFPNPASSKATIYFSLPESCPCQVTLDVFDPLGRKVAGLVNGTLSSDFHSVEWYPGDALSNGLYTYRILVTGTPRGIELLSEKIVLKK